MAHPLSRRQFVAALGAGGALLPLTDALDSLRAADATPRPQPEPAPSGSFPSDTYTPFGYLGNPYHAWELHPSGVLRSVEAMGFGFYFPAGPGGYFDYAHAARYQALLRFGLDLDGHTYLEPGDFAPGQLTATHHSHNLFTFAFTAGALAVALTFFQVGEDTLAMRVVLRNQGDAPALAGLIAAHEYLSLIHI